MQDLIFYLALKLVGYDILNGVLLDLLRSYAQHSATCLVNKNHLPIERGKVH